MSTQTPIEDEPDPDALINVLIKQLADDPGNVNVHRELRTAALRRKVNGGPPAGMLQGMWPLPSDPLRRLIHIERLWALDPGNLELVVKVSRAIEACAVDRPEVDFEPVRHWLDCIVQAARDEP